MPKETNKEKALSALLRASSIAEAAKLCQLSEKTLRRYLDEKDFLTEYRAARRQVVENAIAQLQNAALDAVETLKQNLHCENPAAENRAAQIILENAVKGVETIDILERVERLENELENKN
jgi:DNA-binding transcriptional MerR regulator